MDKFILIDLETQKFYVESGIYEVACLVLENYEVVDSLYLGKEIPEFNGDRTLGYGFFNISEDDEIISKFKEFIKRYPYPLVAHNSSFDRKFLLEYKWIDEDYPIFCSINAIKKTDGTLKSYKLENLVKHFEVSDEVKHKAMSDVYNLYQVLMRIKPQNWSVDDNKNIKKRGYFKDIKARSLEEIDLDIPTTDILNGHFICFTGENKYARNTMHEIALKNGASFTNSITKKTTMLVVGEISESAKLSKASEKGIPIISETKFLQRLNLLDHEITIN
jgi:DNA polymerase III epsilon subunit-like protein